MIELFRANTVAASMLAAVSFIAGALATCIVCRLVCRGRCQKGGRGKFAPSSSSAALQGGARAQKHTPPPDGSIEIYVGNLSYDLTEERLRKEFEAFGTVSSARIITNRYNGKSKGFGFVHMPNEKEVEAALAALSDKDLLGRKLRCNVAKNT